MINLKFECDLLSPALGSGVAGTPTGLEPIDGVTETHKCQH